MRSGIFQPARKLLPLITLTLLIALPFLAQQQEQDIFSPVPAESRGRLVERLKLMLEYRSRDNLSAEYDMLFGPIPEMMTREEYTRPSSPPPSRIVSFTPRIVDQKELEEVRGANWRIVGDVKVRNADGSEEMKEGVVYAQLRDGEWYFTGIITTRVELRRQVIVF